MSNSKTRKSCVVPMCKSTTTKAPEKLFFLVPMDINIRKKWLKAMKRLLDPFGDKSKVYCCDDHFDIENDMENYVKYKLVGSKLQLKKGIVPHKFKCQEEHYDKPQTSAVKKQSKDKDSSRKMSSCTKQKIPSTAGTSICSESITDKLTLQKENGVCHMPVCRVCLATNVKLHHMLEYQLSAQYAQVTGLEINSEDRLPQMLCWECVGRLASASRFIEKAHKSQCIISKKIDSGTLITLDDIELIDKVQHKLQSSLGMKFNDVNYCDLYIDTNKKRIEMHNTLDCNNETSDNKELYLDYKVEAEIDNTNNYNNDVSHNKEINIGKENSEQQNTNECKNEPDNIYNGFNLSNIIDVSFVEDPLKTKEYDVEEVTENNFVFTYKDSGTDTDSEHVDIKIENETESEDEVLHMEHGSKEQMEWNAQNYLMNFSCTDRPTEENTRNPTTATTSRCTNKISKPAGPFICHYCNKSFNVKGSLRAHVQTHLTSFSCPYCDHTTRFERYLEAHINSKHTKKITYPCSYCDFKSLSRMSLRSHVKLKHVKTYITCPHCDHKTHSTRNLKEHINSIHTRSIVFDCTYCDYRSTRKNYLDEHVNAKHTKSVSYDCSQCSYKTHYRRCLNSHVRKLHPS